MITASRDIYINLFKKLGDLDRTLKPTTLINSCIDDRILNNNTVVYPVFSSLVYGYMFNEKNTQKSLDNECCYAMCISVEHINTYRDNVYTLNTIIDDIPTAITNTKTINKLFRKIDDARFNLDKHLNKKFKLLLKLTICLYKCYIDYTRYINTADIESINLHHLNRHFENLEQQLEALHIPHEKDTTDLFSSFINNNYSKEKYYKLYFDPLNLLNLRAPKLLNNKAFLNNTLANLKKPYIEFNISQSL